MALNPVAYTEKVVTSFLRYQLTAYPFADPGLYEQMRALLSLEETRRTPLLRGPYISLSRPFREGAAVSDVVGTGLLHPHVANIASFPQLYGHQERAIRAVLARKTTLVSTGTGSGKTETFLYPIISRCLQLRDEHAPPGIVAVIVYPMNALAEDQLLRLRGLLAGTHIPFGMYVGKTPEHQSEVVGERLPTNSTRVEYEARRAAAEEEGRGKAVYPAEERCSREEMRAPNGQPRILLTNVKQLELLLTRQADIQMFDNARLAFLVFDEAHTYGGAIGGESACLIRRLRAFCGRTAKETVCIATSATLADPGGQGAARTFASRFFGIDPQDVELVAEEYAKDEWRDPRRVPPAPPAPAATLQRVLSAIDETGELKPDISNAYKDLSGEPLNGTDPALSLYDALSANEVVYQLSDTLTQPRFLGDVVRTLSERVGRSVTEEEVLAWLALGAASRRDGRPLLRPVAHAFVRGIDGAVVTFPYGSDTPRLWLSAEDEQASEREQSLARLPVMTCSTCGQHYFSHSVSDFAFTKDRPDGGLAKGGTRAWPTTTAASGGKRVVLVDALVSSDDDDDQQPARTAPLFSCRKCGTLHPEQQEACLECGEQGPLVRLWAVKQDEDNPGQLTRCLSCGAMGHSWGGAYREPARPLRAVAVSDVHVLAQDMLRHAERRRLLVFTDNRQDAAFQAGWMRDHARRFRLRAVIAEAIGSEPVSVGDLTARLAKRMDEDDELSQALLPEVWQQASKAGAPVEHRRERKTFLRIQVLREVTTGAKQRVGLEPWGRIRVEYAGLLPDDPVLARQASQLGLDPVAYADGVAGMLGRLRRGSLVVHDRVDELFTRMRREGAHEVMNGYVPVMLGVPKGMKLQRGPNDDDGRIVQWLSERGDTLVRQVLRKWGVPTDTVGAWAEDLWSALISLGVLSPVTLKGERGNPLPRCSGTYQIEGDGIRIVPHRGLWRCRKCRRAQPRPAPYGRCLTWRCDGTLVFEEERADNYDLSLLDGNVEMIRPREHSAQVPPDEREQIERLFKGETEALNTLVCTPTLELGVDIGSLDTILMRNVPPLPANYWQRAGRAGRRHRMAVNLTYARPVSHDRAYFTDPLKLLGGLVEPPRFNMKNAPMVGKHVHAAVLTRLHQLARPNSGLSALARDDVRGMLEAVFPRQIKDYLFDQDGAVRQTSFDVSALGRVVALYEPDLLDSVRRTFREGWPADDAEVTSDTALREALSGMTQRLDGVVRLLKRRLDWARGQIKRLNERREVQGTLDSEDEALFRRCDLLVKRYKGLLTNERREQGIDETNTYAVLAREGFLPGYGLEIGAIRATGQIPRGGGTDLDLPRAPAIALREYVPGNLIYANGHRFVPRYFQLQVSQDAGGGGVDPIDFQVDLGAQAVMEAGGGTGVLGAGAMALSAVPVCDVNLSHTSRISDEEEYRFQMPVAVYGYELDRHSGGQAYKWGSREPDLLWRRGVHMRLVNVGPARSVQRGDPLGYPVCLVCGQSRSPFASRAELTHFRMDHHQRCGREVESIGFYATTVVDMLTLPDCADATEAYSLAEALRSGATRVLDMQRGDLDIVVIRHAGSARADAHLFDPMPGGSGLLDQLCKEFPAVMEAARAIAAGCPAVCAQSCIDCFQTFRNAFFHRYLDRHKVVERIDRWGAALTFTHDIPSRMPAVPADAGHRASGDYEARLGRMLKRAGFPDPEWSKTIYLGRPLGSTRPDCFFAGEDERDPGTCVYLDGLSGRIHGAPARRAEDQALRQELRARHYEVLEIAASDLDDRYAMAQHFFKLARAILGRERAREIRDEPGWFEAAKAV
jgi:hypothetical protein